MRTYKIVGKPIPLRRPRINRYTTIVYDSQAEQKQDTKLQLKLQHKNSPFFCGPLTMYITFFMPVPKSTSKRLREALLGTPHIKKPDLDNLVKWVLDCANGILYKDDSLVYNLTVCKKYSDEPRTELAIFQECDEQI